MTIEVDIQVQGGKVNVCVGGKASSKASQGAVAAQAAVGGQLKTGAEGGSGANEDSGTGGGGPGSGTLVIGPIVTDCSALGRTGVDAGSQGGSGANEDPHTGGGGAGTGSGSGTLVIGPIVISGQSNAASFSAAATTPKGVAVNPPSPKKGMA